MVSSITTFILQNRPPLRTFFSEAREDKKVGFEAFERPKYSPDAYRAAFSINAIFSSEWSLVSETFEIAPLKSLPVILESVES